MSAKTLVLQDWLHLELSISTQKQAHQNEAMNAKGERYKKF
jgi:hypothetical protein